MRPLFRDILIVLAVVVVIFFLLHITLQSFVIDGSSMQPNFQEGERLLINKVIYHFHDPDRGDVIVFHPPDDPSKSLIKRIIALPGDTVEVKDGAVYVNDTKLDELAYIKEPPSGTFPLMEIPENEYFVLGDNRNYSRDSRIFGTVPRENIIGKVWLLFWPPHEWGFVHHYPLEEQLEGSTSE